MYKKLLRIMTAIIVLMLAITACSSPDADKTKEDPPSQPVATAQDRLENRVTDNVSMTEEQKNYNYLVYPEYDDMQKTIIESDIWVKKVTEQGEKYGYISIIDGRIILPLEYDGIQYWEGMSDAGTGCSQGRFVVKKGDKWGFVSRETEHEDIKYEDAWYYYKGVAAVKINGKWGYVNGDGEFVIEPVYEDVMQCRITFDVEKNSHQPFESGAAYVKDREGYFFINDKGEQISPDKYDSVYGDHIIRGDPTLFLVEKGQKYGVIKIEDSTLKEVVAIKYDKIYQIGTNVLRGFIDIFNEDIFAYAEHYLIDLARGTELLVESSYIEEYQKDHRKEIYEEVSKEDDSGGTIDIENYFQVQKGGKFGLRNADGYEVVPCIFDAVANSKFGVAPVKASNGKYGLVLHDYVIEHYERDIDMDGTVDNIRLLLSGNNDIIVKVNQKDNTVFEDENMLRHSFWGFRVYNDNETPHIKFMQDKKAGMQYLAVVKIYATNKIGSTMHMKMYDQNMNEIFLTDMDKPDVTTWYDSKFNISIPEYNYEKTLDITPEEIVKKACLPGEIAEELKQRGQNIKLNVYRGYELKDVNEDGTEELILNRICYVLSAPFYLYSDFIEVYEFNNGMNLMDCYFEGL